MVLGCTKNNGETMETESIKEWSNGMEIEILKIGLTERTFRDKDTKEEKTVPVMVFKAKNNGKDAYYTANENTVVYKQALRHIIEDLGNEIGINDSVDVNETVHIEILKSQSTKYSFPSIREWQTSISTEKLFGE